MDSISFIKSPISAELEDFKKHFDSCLSSSNLLLNSVIAHIRQKNGKMMRPILVLLAAKLYNEICPATLHAAVALELLHTASLVHDDVVDESTERRGQLSVNAVFNNKVAVLTGDYLLATALVEVGMTRNYGIIDIVSKLGQDLAEGELLQLSNVSNPEYSEDIYFDVIRKKTAVLFAACMKAGALSVGAGDEKAEYARQVFNDAAFQEIVALNITENAFSRNKLPKGVLPNIKSYKTGNALVGIDLSTGEFHIESENIEEVMPLHDDLFVYRGLDEEDLKNIFLVAEYVKLMQN